jgi:hypothetical protein
MAHRLETAIEHLVARGHAGACDVERLVARVDAIEVRFDLLRRGDVDHSEPMPLAAVEPVRPSTPAVPPSDLAPLAPLTGGQRCGVSCAVGQRIKADVSVASTQADGASAVID